MAENGHNEELKEKLLSEAEKGKASLVDRI